MAVSNSVPSSSTLKFDDVVSVILSEEMQRKSIGETLGNALPWRAKGDKMREEGAQKIMASLKREGPSPDSEK